MATNFQTISTRQVHDVCDAMPTTFQSIPTIDVKDVTITTTAESTPANQTHHVQPIPESQNHTVTRVPSVPATKVSCMFFIITILFLLSYTHYLVLKIASAQRKDFMHFSRVAGTFYYLGYNCIFMNSMCNPIVYRLFDVQFKKECQRIYKAVKDTVRINRVLPFNQWLHI
jgi:hypothetical protein